MPKKKTNQQHHRNYVQSVYFIQFSNIV